MKNRTKILALISLAAGLVCPRLGATVVGVDLGTGLPPTTLGSYTMAAFDPGFVTGQSYFSHEVAGNWDGVTTGGEGQWNTWGQNYAGNVYVAYTSSSLTLLLSGGAHAVYFYEEPNVYDNFYMTATDSSGVSVTTLINGYHGSSGVGFYETNPLDTLVSIVVTCTDPSGFAIGEFGLDSGTLTGTVGTVPDAASTAGLIVVGFGLISFAGKSRFGQRFLPSRA